MQFHILGIVFNIILNKLLFCLFFLYHMFLFSKHPQPQLVHPHHLFPSYNNSISKGISLLVFRILQPPCFTFLPLTLWYLSFILFQSSLKSLFFFMFKLQTSPHLGECIIPCFQFAPITPSQPLDFL
jgi:hypothetical protein